jgi:hypothetical protein
MVRVNGRLALLVLVSLLAAPAAFSQAVSFSTTFSPNFSQTHADFNSDGEEDFIVSYGNSFYEYLGSASAATLGRGFFVRGRAFNREGREESLY